MDVKGLMKNVIRFFFFLAPKNGNVKVVECLTGIVINHPLFESIRTMMDF